MFNLKIKILILLINIVAIGFGVYYGNYTILAAGILFFFYFLWVFRKWKRAKCKNNFNRKVLGMNDIILFFLIVLVLRLFNIQVLNNKKYADLVKNQIQGTYIEKGLRGNIYDSSGKELGYNINIYNIFVDPERIYDNKDAINAIKEIIDTTDVEKNKKTFFKEIEEEGRAGRRYKVLSKAVSEKTYEDILKIKKKYGLINNEIFVEKESRRKYYKKDIYQKVVGAVGFVGDNKFITGTVGVEKEYENYLRGRTVRRKSVFAKNRNFVLPTAKEELPLHLNGKNVYLTIDNDLQYILNDEIKKQFEETRSEAAYGMIMDPNTGRILATSAISHNKKSYRNPLFQSQFEPGSIFKPVVVAGALYDGFVTKKSTFDVKDGKIKKYNHIIRESSKSTKGVLDLPTVLAKSSNVAMVLISDLFNDSKMEEIVKKFGFYDKTHIDFPYEIKPYTRKSRHWNGLTRNTMAFGQGIAVTPIQMISAFSAIINGGTLYKPYLVDKIENEKGEVIRRNRPIEVSHPIDEKTSKLMREMLENVVEVGGGRHAKLAGYRIGGKTGTAQISGGKSGYIKNDYLTSFVGFFPADKPEYIGIIMFYKPQVDKLVRYGGTVAAPVFKEVVKRITMNKGIKSNEIEKLNIKVKEKKVQHVEKAQLVTMPDLTGMSLRDVILLFKNNNIEVTPVGVGIVEKQFPQKDEDLKDIKEIKIYLK